MTYPFPADVQHLVSEWMSARDYPSEDDVLRDAPRALAEEKEDLRAVQEAIAEWRAGDGAPLEDKLQLL